MYSQSIYMYVHRQMYGRCIEMSMLSIIGGEVNRNGHVTEIRTSGVFGGGCVYKLTRNSKSSALFLFGVHCRLLCCFVFSISFSLFFSLFLCTSLSPSLSLSIFFSVSVFPPPRRQRSPSPYPPTCCAPIPCCLTLIGGQREDSEIVRAACWHQQDIRIKCGSVWVDSTMTSPTIHDLHLTMHIILP